LDADLRAIKTALAELSDPELRALISYTTETPQYAPGFLTWLDHACDWETRRRAGLDFRLVPLASVIPPEQDAVSGLAAILLRKRFADMPAVAALFGTIFAALTGDAGRH
jgi:hypothetical protein